MNEIKLSYLIIILLLGRCTLSQSNDYFIINSVEKEWKLEKINDNSELLEFNQLYIVFHKNHTYDIYRKRKGKKYIIATDNKLEHHWVFDNSDKLHISTFQNLEVLQLEKKTLVFKHGREKYSFVCETCE